VCLHAYGGERAHPTAARAPTHPHPPARPPACLPAAQGLPPGRYHYKYLVDSTWCIDLAAPNEADLWGNVNNVVDVEPLAVFAHRGAAGLAGATADVGDGMGGAITEQQEQDGGGGNSDDAGSPSDDGGPPPGLECSVSPEEQLRTARFGAALLALCNKMGVGCRHTPPRPG
jgi:hypothetical protein